MTEDHSPSYGRWTQRFVLACLQPHYCRKRRPMANSQHAALAAPCGHLQCSSFCCCGRGLKPARGSTSELARAAFENAGNPKDLLAGGTTAAVSYVLRAKRLHFAFWRAESFFTLRALQKSSV